MKTITLLMLTAGLLACTSPAALADKATVKKMIDEGLTADKVAKWKKITWSATPKKALAAAKKSGKPILVFMAVPMNKYTEDGKC